MDISHCSCTEMKKRERERWRDILVLRIVLSSCRIDEMFSSILFITIQNLPTRKKKRRLYRCRLIVRVVRAFMKHSIPYFINYILNINEMCQYTQGLFLTTEQKSISYIFTGENEYICTNVLSHNTNSTFIKWYCSNRTNTN